MNPTNRLNLTLVSLTAVCGIDRLSPRPQFAFFAPTVGFRLSFSSLTFPDKEAQHFIPAIRWLPLAKNVLRESSCLLATRFSRPQNPGAAEPVRDPPLSFCFSFWIKCRRGDDGAQLVRQCFPARCRSLF